MMRLELLPGAGPAMPLLPHPGIRLALSLTLDLNCPSQLKLRGPRLVDWERYSDIHEDEQWVRQVRGWRLK